MPEPVLDRHLLEALRHLTIRPRTAAWIEEMVGPSLLTKTDQVKSARRSLEEALQAATHENDELLNLRLRGQVDDATFERKRLELLDRQARLKLQLEQPEIRPEEQLERLRRVLRYSVSAPRLFESGDGVSRRQIVETMTSNWKVKDGKPVYVAKNPFSILAGATSRPNWWATCRLVLTWLAENASVSLPDVTAGHGPVENSGGGDGLARNPSSAVKKKQADSIPTKTREAA
jgi:hypothetical protein